MMRTMTGSEGILLRRVIFPVVLVVSSLWLQGAQELPDPLRRPLRAQIESPAQIRGTVSDLQGNPLPQVVVTATLKESNQRQGAVTDENGEFIISNLNPGVYDLQQEKPGFPTQLISGIELREGEIHNLVLILELADSPLAMPRLRPRSEKQPPSIPASPTELSEPEPAPGIRRPLRTAKQGEPAAEAPFSAQGPEFRPSGYAGRDSRVAGTNPMQDFISIADRWRLGLPEWDRYSPYVQHGDFPYTRGRRLDPYNQNVWKGDYPILGDRWFMALTGTSDTLLEYRQLPIVGPPSASRPGTPEFFSKGDQFQLLESLIFSADFFRGYTAFQPFDIRFKVTPVFNGNYLKARETGVVNIDVDEVPVELILIWHCRKPLPRSAWPRSAPILTSFRCALEPSSSTAIFAASFSSTINRESVSSET